MTEDLRLTFDKNDKDWKNVLRAYKHSKRTWKGFLYYCAQLYWEVELKKRHGDLKIN